MDRSWKQLDRLVRATRPPREGDSFEVIIVGAGLSGLAAAYELRAQKPLVLEREPRLGGRVLTRTQQGVPYDLGAVFALDARALPFESKPRELFVEPARSGLYIGGVLYPGADALECCAALGLDAAEWTGLARFMADTSTDAATLSPRLYAVLNAFFQIIYPGNLKEYAPQVQHQAFHTFVPLHLTHGNQTLITELAQRSELTHDGIPNSRLRLGAVVQEIVEDGGQVRVTYQEGDTRVRVSARAVIVTLPPPLVSAVVRGMEDASLYALEQVHYAPGIVVALGVRGIEPGELGCIVTPDAPTSTLFIQHTQVPGIHTLLVYFAGDKAAGMWHVDDATLVRCAFDTVKQVAGADTGELVFSDVQRWEHIGPVMDAATQHFWQTHSLTLTPHIVLGGELAAGGDRHTLPYGMQAALQGGYRAAHQVKQILTQENHTNRFASHYLIDAVVYEFSADRPRFVERRREGNIAFYGLVLGATRDAALKNYLLGAARDGLWEYQDGFGVTAEDSALVLEGLLEAGADRDRLLAAARALVRLFYDAANGAFVTLRGGRAPYWLGPSVDASAHIAYLLRRIDPEEFEQAIQACARFVASQQQADGVWQGKWFPSQMITTYYAVRLLAKLDYTAECERATQAILKQQTRGGSWQASVIDTSAALLALKELDCREADAAAALERGRAWLGEEQKKGWRGEPVLYYWYALEDGTRLFYHCTDRGEVTGAWAMLALRPD